MNILLTLCLLLVSASIALAEETKVPSCQDQLTEATLQAYNLDVDRDTKERHIAKYQARAYTLEQKILLLERQLADLKKSTEPKKAE